MVSAQMTVDVDRASGVVACLEEGGSFAILDCAHGRAWGYAIDTHRVGYVDEDVFG